MGENERESRLGRWRLPRWRVGGRRASWHDRDLLDRVTRLEQAVESLVTASATPPQRESPERRAAVIRQTQEMVADRFGLTRGALIGANRSQGIVYARQVAMFLCRELTDASLPGIGKAFGGRDHTTVLHASTKISRLMLADATVRELVDELRTKLGPALESSARDAPSQRIRTTVV